MTDISKIIYRAGLQQFLRSVRPERQMRFPQHTVLSRLKLLNIPSHSSGPSIDSPIESTTFGSQPRVSREGLNGGTQHRQNPQDFCDKAWSQQLQSCRVPVSPSAAGFVEAKPVRNIWEFSGASNYAENLSCIQEKHT